MPTPEQEAVIAAARERLRELELQQQVPTQMIRAAAQGLTYNTADEIEAAVRSAFSGRPKEEIEREIRLALSEYRKQNPAQAMAAEFAGAAIPAAIATVVTRNPAPAEGIFSKFFPNIAKATGIGASEGAASTVGAMEQPFSERFGNVGEIATGAAIGGALGGGIYSGGTAALKGADFLSEAARFISGSRSRNAVNNEIQRIAEEAGITPDDALMRLARGELIAEDPNVAEAIRPLIGGGESSKVIRTTLEGRPAEARRAAITTIRSGIASGLDRNIYRQMRADDKLLRQLESNEYRNAFESVQDANQDVVNQMYETISRFPNAGDKLKAAFKSETGKDPFFVVDDKGVISFRMLPTMKDAEQLRRIISAESRKLIQSGGADATVGINLSSSERSLRESIDNASPAIATARENARLVRARNENYQNGKKASSKNADEIEVEFQDVLNSKNANLIQAYRLGYLESLNAKMEGGNKASTVARITDPETKEGRIFRIIYPGDLQQAALERLDVAKQAQDAARKLLTGSATAPTLQAAQRMGTISRGVSTGGLAVDALRGDINAAANILDRVIAQFRPGLTDAQRTNVAQILLSRDPQIVGKALRDREGLKSLQSVIIPIADAPLLIGAAAGSQVLTTEIQGK